MRESEAKTLSDELIAGTATRRKAGCCGFEAQVLLNLPANLKWIVFSHAHFGEKVELSCPFVARCMPKTLYMFIGNRKIQEQKQ